MTPRRVAFVGPTLPQPVRPDLGFDYLPPIRHGDLFALALQSGDQVLIIDGVYQHFAPIRHKEILAVIAAGARVAGTASLGALRAAELADFGMQGLGQVYQAARAGQLTSDADVAVLHSDLDSGSRRLTVAMVSFRDALAAALEDGLTDQDCGALEAIAAGLHFTERSEQALRQVAAETGYGPQMRQVLDRAAQRVDLKTRDALAALQTLASGDHLPHAGAAAVAVWESSYGSEWSFERRPLRPGSPVSEQLGLACLQLFASDFPARHRGYAQRLARETIGGGGCAAALLAAAGFAGEGDHSAAFAAPSRATADWTIAERQLTRTFRLKPGRLVYLGLTPEALAGITLDQLERWCLRLLRGAHVSPAPPAAWHALLGELWQATTAEQYRLCVLERGFRDEAEAARLANAFDLQLVRALASPVSVAS